MRSKNAMRHVASDVPQFEKVGSDVMRLLAQGIGARSFPGPCQYGVSLCCIALNTFDAYSKLYWYSVWCSIAVPTSQVPFVASTSMPRPVEIVWPWLPSRSWSAVHPHIFSMYAEDVLVRWRRPHAALQMSGDPAQLVWTLEPAAPPIRKWEFQRPTSPGVLPAMFTSTYDQELAKRTVELTA